MKKFGLVLAKCIDKSQRKSHDCNSEKDTVRVTERSTKNANAELNKLINGAAGSVLVERMEKTPEISMNGTYP